MMKFRKYIDINFIAINVSFELNQSLKSLNVMGQTLRTQPLLLTRSDISEKLEYRLCEM